MFIINDYLIRVFKMNVVEYIHRNQKAHDAKMRKISLTTGIVSSILLIIAVCKMIFDAIH
jgi:hypothetical protein